MIWFFIGGWICGAVFVVMYARWKVERDMEKMQKQQNESEEKDHD